MPYVSRVAIEPIRTLGFASISGTYAAVGTPLVHPIRIIVFTNFTNGILFISDDGVNDKLIVAASSFKLFDLDTNRDGGVNEQFKLAIGTQLYVRQSTAPTSGSFYIECLYASGE